MLSMVSKGFGYAFLRSVMSQSSSFVGWSCEGSSSVPEGLAKGLPAVNGLVKGLPSVSDGPEKGISFDGLVIG